MVCFPIYVGRTPSYNPEQKYQDTAVVPGIRALGVGLPQSEDWSFC
jgi:hypothetical protein